MDPLDCTATELHDCAGCPHKLTQTIRLTDMFTGGPGNYWRRGAVLPSQAVERDTCLSHAVLQDCGEGGGVGQNCIAGCPTLTEGWCTVFRLMRHMWHSAPEEIGRDVVELLYVVSDDQCLPTLMSQHIELNPLIVWCPLKLSDRIRDLGDRVAEVMLLVQDLPPLQWDVLIERSSSMTPLFYRDFETWSAGSSGIDSSVHDNPKPPKAAPKPAAKVPVPKVKRQPKTNAA